MRPVDLPMNLPVLYSFRRCPYAMRARLALHASGIRVELREVVLRAKPAHLLSISPKGTVPVLLLPEGQVIEQSLDIMRWALRQNDPQGWLTACPDEQAQTQAWLTLNDGPFKALLDRYKYPERHPERTASAWRDEAVELMLAPMERALQAHAQLLGPTVSLADMALLPFVRQFAQVDASWFAQAPLPRLQGWLSGHLASPLFKSIMGKVLPWSGGPTPRVF
jgi:glutathione S-transferase